MTTFQGADLCAHMLPVVEPLRRGHRAATATGGHLLMSDTGLHVRARRSLWPYLVAVLVPLAGVLLVLLAVRMTGPSPTANVVPAPVQVQVSPTACTFPDGS
jgi:hypothetical protein